MTCTGGKGEFYLAQVLVQPLMCSSEQRSDGEAVRVLLIYNLRLLQQRVELLPDLRLNYVLRGSVRLGREKKQKKQTYSSVLKYTSNKLILDSTNKD